MFTLVTKKSEEKRYSTSSLEDMMMSSAYSHSRIAENHGLEYFVAQLGDEVEGSKVELICNRKLKKSAVAIKKASSKEFDYCIQISSIQVSYSSLVEAKILASKLIKIWDIEGKIFEFPSGNKEKGFGDKFKKLAEKYDISRFDGFDLKVANGSNHLCSSKACGYHFGAVNMPDPSKPYSCPRCSSPMISERIHYNYRSNSYHWGTFASEQLLSEIDPRGIHFLRLSSKLQDKILEMKGINRSEIAGLESIETLNIEVESKADQFDAMTYSKLVKAALKSGYDMKQGKTKAKLLDFLRAP
ncbi:MAG: hypothetical protein ACR2M6_02730 [Vampirovibrionia bacterium]